MKQKTTEKIIFNVLLIMVALVIFIITISFIKNYFPLITNILKLTYNQNSTSTSSTLDIILNNII